MIRNLILFIILPMPLTTMLAQSSNLDDTLQLMLNQERYEEITGWMNHVNADTLSAMSLYYTGVAYFVRENDAEAVKFLEQSVKKDPHFADAYYYLGLINEYNGQWEKAKSLYQAALANDPGNALYLEHLGDVLNTRGLSDSAYTMYQKIADKEQTPARIYMKIAEIFVERGADEKALEVYYDCLYNAESNSDYYNDCLYNVGHFEYRFGNYRDAAMVLETLYDRNPEDYAVIEKLIQVYLKRENFNKVNDYRSQLYKAHKEGWLPEDLQKRFLLNEFESGDNEVIVYEYYDDPDAGGDIKYAFVVLGEADSVQTEFALEYSSFARNKGAQYVVTEKRDEKKYLYPEALFGERINFQKLKKTIDDILNGKLEPADQ